MTTEERIAALEQGQGFTDWRVRQLQENMLALQSSHIALSDNVSAIKADLEEVKTIVRAISQKIEQM